MRIREDSLINEETSEHFYISFSEPSDMLTDTIPASASGMIYFDLMPYSICKI